MLFVPNRQAAAVDALVRAANAARHSAAAGNLFASRSGLALVNAAFDLFECDGLYDLAMDVAAELRIDGEGFPVDRYGDRITATGAKSR